MYYTKEYLTSLAPKIKMPEEGFSNALKYFDIIAQKEADDIAHYFADLSCPRREKHPTIQKIADMENGDILCLLIYMASAGYTYENYKKLGIPDEIFYDSFNCLAEKMVTAKRFTSRWGYASVFWPIRVTNLQTFRIGRLSYAMEYAAEDIIADGKILIPKDSPFLNIHIADNDKLCGCEDSVRAARVFFEKFFPEYKDAVMYTNTWLLDPRLAEILPEGSNILKFQEIFHIFDYSDDNSAALSRIFGNIKENLDEYTPETSLARAVIDYLKSGKMLGRGAGYTVL